MDSILQTMKRKTLLAMLGLGLAGAALAAPPLQDKSATLQCADRRVDVEAACFPYAGRIMACTRQAIRFSGADGKPLGARVFQPAPLQEGDDYPVVEEKIGELDCVETKEKKTFVVASMSNGGNCAQCEWYDVYSTEGTLLGSTRDPKKNGDAMKTALGALHDKTARRVLNQQSLTGFYQNRGAK